MGEECFLDSLIIGLFIDFLNLNVRIREGKCECRYFLKLFIIEICLFLFVNVEFLFNFL